MAARESLKTFVDNIAKFDQLLVRGILNKFTLFTNEALTTAQKSSPKASGTLERSGSVKRAKITPTGVESGIVFNAPYALFLEGGVLPNGKEIKYKKRGEISYYAGGTKIRKARRGGDTFASRGVRSQSKKILDALNDEISKVFNFI